MNKSATQNKPSVKELLVSIRQAIHDNKSGLLGNIQQKPTEHDGDGLNQNSSVSGSMNQMRVSLQPDDNHLGVSPRQQDDNYVNSYTNLVRQHFMTTYRLCLSNPKNFRPKGTQMHTSHPSPPRYQCVHMLQVVLLVS